MSALLHVERSRSTRNTPADAQFHVYGPVPGTALCSPGIGSALWHSLPLLVTDFPDPPACRQCPSGRRAPETFPDIVRTISARRRSPPDRERHPPDSSSTTRRPSDLPVPGRLRDTPRTAHARGHCHPAI